MDRGRREKTPDHAADTAGADGPAPEACRTMADVRAGIDRLDRRLVTLLARRQRYIEAAAALKTDRSQVRDPQRIEDVVHKVLAEAERRGLSPAIAEPVWRTLIEGCIAHEFEIFDRLKRGRGDA